MKKAIFLETIYENKDKRETELVRILWNAEDNKFLRWKDKKRFHYPYVYTTEPVLLEPFNRPFLYDQYPVKKYHPLQKRDIDLYKVRMLNPYATKFIKEEIDGITANNIYENDIKYETRWCIDTEHEFGTVYYYEDTGTDIVYDVIRGDPHPDIEKYKALIKKNHSFDPQLLDKLFPLLMNEFIFPKAIGIDIEVLISGRVIPNPKFSPNPITSIAIAYQDRPNVVLLLDSVTRNIERGNDTEFMKRVLKKEIEVKWYKKEINLLQDFIKLVYESEAAVMLTFNGDYFDIPYLYNRMKFLGVFNNPFKRKTMARNDPTSVYWIVEPIMYDDGGNAYIDGGGKPKLDLDKYIIHVDLYRFFKMPYIQNYAFKNKYKRKGLQDISEALLGTGKVEYDGTLNDLELWKLAKYNLVDSELLVRLWTLSNNIVPSLMIMFMRLGFQGMIVNGRKQISSKLNNFFQWRAYHRGWIKPKKSEFPRIKSEVKSKIKGKEFQGAEVIEPIVGIFFDVRCEDFAGLYTNIMDKRNISPETMNCGHPECIDNIIPEVEHHVCTINVGIASELIGIVTTSRSIVFKPLKKDPFYSAIEQALKVFGNAAYGVLGAPFFNWFSIAATESITAVGRNSIIRLKEKAEELGMTVIRGDTDSIFVVDYTPETLAELYRFSKEELGLELELEYEGRYILNSIRKKNYIVFTYDNDMIMKGLKLKKRNTPQIIKDIGNDIIDILKTVKDRDDLNKALGYIQDIVERGLWKIRKKKGEIEEYLYFMEIKKPLHKYLVKTQHVVAANIEADYILKNEVDGAIYSKNDIIQVGKIQEFIKTDTYHKVLPLVLADLKYIRVSAYLKELQSSINPLIELLQLNIDFGYQPTKNLNSFFRGAIGGNRTPSRHNR